jgi:hypothetical protein
VRSYSGRNRNSEIGKLVLWIPAIAEPGSPQARDGNDQGAGMTGASNGIGFQMTPTPAIAGIRFFHATHSTITGFARILRSA